MAIMTPKVKEILSETNACNIRISSEKEALKEMQKKLSEEMGVSNKLAGKIIRTYYKGSFQAESAEYEEFSIVMETLVGSTLPRDRDE